MLSDWQIHHLRITVFWQWQEITCSTRTDLIGKLNEIDGAFSWFWFRSACFLHVRVHSTSEPQTKHLRFSREQNVHLFIAFWTHAEGCNLLVFSDEGWGLNWWTFWIWRRAWTGWSCPGYTRGRLPGIPRAPSPAGTPPKASSPGARTRLTSQRADLTEMTSQEPEADFPKATPETEGCTTVKSISKRLMALMLLLENPAVILGREGLTMMPQCKNQVAEAQLRA